MEPPRDTPLRLTADPRRAEDWALTLVSDGIPSRLEEDATGWTLFVAADDFPRAKDTLDAYDAENPQEVAPPAPVEYGGSWLGALVAVGLFGFFLVTGGREGGAWWFEAGHASAERILHGEWWRAVTALTLHADFSHVLGNAVACLVFVTAVAEWVGPGVGAWLVLLSGVFGNLLTAWVHRSHHLSVGASTATFGAIGIIAALQYAARRRGRSSRRKPWVVVAAALALFGMLGTGERSDVFAHLFGLLSGAALGTAAAALLPRPPRTWVQVALSLSAAAAVVACWLTARP
jgi:rhomboid protease GluP